MTTPSECIGTLAGGRYQLERILGRGGMATVYAAWDTRLDLRRAVKILDPTMLQNTAVRERFEREARLMARLRHPHILTVHDVGEEDGKPYIIMELLTGGSLADLITVDQGMDPVQALTYGQQVLEALEFAHGQGVTHRDIKPENVLLDEHGAAKVADFGIARWTTDQHAMTRTGAVMGTWAYMAPELRTGAKRAGPHSDIYAVGAMLFTCFTGKLPFDIHSEEVRKQSLADVVPPVRTLIEGSTSYHPDHRFPSAADMAGRVEDARKAISSVHDRPPPVPAASVEPSPSASETMAFDVPVETDRKPTSPTLAEEPALPRTADTLAAEPPPREPARPSLWAGWRAGAVGVLASSPLLAGLLIAMTGDLGYAVKHGGVAMVAVVILAALSVGASVLLGSAERRGRGAMAGWLLRPSLTLLTGMAFVVAAAQQLLEALGGGDEKAGMVAYALGEAVLLQSVTLAMASLGLIAAALAIALAQRPSLDEAGARRAGPLAASVLVGGTALWAAQRLLSDSDAAQGLAPFAVLVVILLGTAAGTLLPAVEGGLRSRAKIAVCTALAAGAAGLSIEAHTQLQRFEAIAHMAAEDKLEGMVSLMAALAEPAVGWSLAWAALAAVAGLAPWLRRPMPPPLFTARQVGLPLLLVLAGATATGSGLYLIARGGQALLPWVTNNSLEFDLGLRLAEPDETTPAWARGGLRVTMSRAPELEPGDVVVAVGGVPVTSAQDLLQRLNACDCDMGDGACSLGPDCIEPGTLLELSVLRTPGPDQDAKLTTVEIPALQGASEADLGEARTERFARALEQPFFDFVMEPNAERSERSELRRFERWDSALYQDVVAKIAELSTDTELYTRLEEVSEEWAAVLTATREAGLPEVIAAIPYEESRYTREFQSMACAKGYWQFMPETAHRMEHTLGIPLRVQDCRFDDEPDVLWSPTRMAVPKLRDRDYQTNAGCRIPARRGCAIDDRTDLDLSTKVALAELAQAWEQAEVRDSGAAVQLTIAVHNIGFDDGRFDIQRPWNVLPSLRAWAPAHKDEEIPHFYGLQTRCLDNDCLKLLRGPTAAYVVETIALHMVAVCYYASNHPQVAAFQPWQRYADTYCPTLDPPSAAEVARGFAPRAATPEPEEPASRLRGRLSARSRPLMVGLAPIEAVGVDPGKAQAMALYLSATLEDLPNLRVVPLRGPEPAEDVSAWRRRVMEEAGVNTVLQGRLGALGSKSIFNLERSGKDGIEARAYRVVDGGDDALAAELEPMLEESLLTQGAGASPEMIREVISKHLGSIKACYEHALKSDPALAGRIELYWRIAPSGAVKDLEVQGDTVGHASLQACVLEAAEAMLFPASEGGLEVIYPFILSPG